MLYFTSDFHFGHKNIIIYCNRPYSSTDEMNRAIVANFNQIVTKDDITYHLGDFSLSKHFVQLIKNLNGTHHLIVGNHDRCYPHNGNFNEVKKAIYLDHGFSSVHLELELELDGIGPVLLNHMPYVGDTQHQDRYTNNRPKPNDKHKYLLHGHTHSTHKINNNMIHVGVDAWDYKPVSLMQIQQLISE